MLGTQISFWGPISFSLFMPAVYVGFCSLFRSSHSEFVFQFGSMFSCVCFCFHQLLYEGSVIVDKSVIKLIIREWNLWLLKLLVGISLVGFWQFLQSLFSLLTYNDSLLYGVFLSAFLSSSLPLTQSSQSNMLSFPLFVFLIALTPLTASHPPYVQDILSLSSSVRELV